MTDVSNNVKLDIDEIDLSGTTLKAEFPVKLIKRKIKLRDINILSTKKDFEKDIYVKIRSTGKLIKSKITIIENKIDVELLEDEYGISPGQACVFYKKDNKGDKLLGGGWITN